MKFMTKQFKSVSEKQAIINLFTYKLSIYHGRLLMLILLQMIGIAFSFNAEGFSSGSDYYSVGIEIISGNVIIILSFFWAFVQGLNLNGHKAEQMAHLFSATKKTDQCSNALLIFFWSFFLGVTSVLAGAVPKILTQVFLSDGVIYDPVPTVFQVLQSMAYASVYALLIFAISYLLGSISKIHPALILLLPVLLVVYTLLGIDDGYLIKLIQFFNVGTNVLPLLLKVCVTMGLTFYLVYLFDRKLEVPR